MLTITYKLLFFIYLLRVGGVAYRMTLTAFSETWIQSNYLVVNTSWWLEP